MYWTNKIGFEFRTTESAATTQVGDVFVGSDDGDTRSRGPVYPTPVTVGDATVSMGYPSLADNRSRDRNDFPRVGGLHFANNNGTEQVAFQISGVPADRYDIELSMGDPDGGGTATYLTLLDGTTPILEFAGLSASSPSLFDALGNVHADQAAWDSDQEPAEDIPISTGTLFVVLGSATNVGGTSHINYLSLTPKGTGIAITISLDDIDTDEIIESTQTGVVWTGAEFDGTVTAKIAQDGIEVPQTITAGTGTSLTVSTVFDTGTLALKYGSATAVVTKGSDSDSLPITIVPPDARSVVTIGTPNPDDTLRITAVPDLSSGVQLQVTSVVGGAIDAVSLNDDGTWDADEAVTSFFVSAYDPSDHTWSDPVEQTVSDEGAVPPTAPTISAGTTSESTLPITISGGSNATAWTVQFKETSSGTWIDETSPISLGATTFTVNQSLISSTAYNVRLRAINDVGTSYSNILTMTTAASEIVVEEPDGRGLTRALLRTLVGAGLH